MELCHISWDFDTKIWLGPNSQSTRQPYLDAEEYVV